MSAGGVLPGPAHVSAGAAHARRHIHRAAGDSNAGLKGIAWRTQASVFSTSTIVVRQARSGTRARLGFRGSFGRYGGSSGAHHRRHRVAHRAPGHDWPDGRNSDSFRSGVLRCVRHRVINGAGVPTCIRRGRSFCSPQTHQSSRNRIQVALRSLTQLHSYRDRRGVVLRLDAESWCLSIGLCLAAKPKQSGFVVDQRSEPTLAIALDAVRNPATNSHQPGGVAERFKAPVSTEAETRKGREGSIPSSTTEHHSGAPLLNNDRVVQRRRAGQRIEKNRPAPPSPHAQHAAVGRWLRRCSHSRSS